MPARDSRKIHAAIERICQSTAFRSAPQLQKLLRFLVTASVSGDQLKESLIGVQVFERDPTYDPKADSVVRTEVRRLRLKLAAYYIEAGAEDPLIVEIPKGSYTVGFRERQRTSPPNRKRFPIAAALAAALLVALSILAFWRPDRSRAAGPVMVLAVLPFHDQSTNARDLADQTASALARIPNLRVIARSSVDHLKDPSNLRLSANALHANYLVTGELSRDQSQLHVRLEIVSEPGDTHLATENYTSPDVTHLSEQIVAGVSRAIGTSDIPILAHTTTAQPEAEELSRRGRSLWATRSKENLLSALELFRQAARVDPDYVWAYIGMADSYSQLASNSVARPADVLPQAEAAAQRAVQLSPQLAEAHASLGLVRYCQWDWSGAEREYNLARKLNPNLSIVLFRSAITATAFGHFDEALHALEEAELVDPFSTLAQGAISEIYYYQRDYPRAVQAARDWARENPGGYRSFLWKPLLRQGKTEEARAELDKLFELQHLPSNEVTLIRLTFGAIARSSDASAEFHRLLDKGTLTKSHWVLAQLHAGFGEQSAALQELQQALAAREPDLVSVQWDPMFDGLRTDPAYRRLIAGMALAPNL